MTTDNPSFHIQAGVIHRIVKQQHASAQDSYLSLQDNLHEDNGQLDKFVEYSENILLTAGNNRSISGGFGIENTLSKILADIDFNINDNNYLDVTSKLVKGLFEFVSAKSATTGEFVPFVFYEKNGIRYLLITLISLNDYQGISDDAKLSIARVIDKDALKVGLRIDLKAMYNHYNVPNSTEDPEPYVRWIERRRRRLPDYVQDFIPVGNRINNKKSTQDLMAALDGYLKSVFPDDREEQTAIRSDILQMMEHKDYIHIEEDIDPFVKSEMIKRGIENVDFKAYRQQQNLDIDSAFEPDHSTLTSYLRFKFSLDDSDLVVQGKRQHLGKKVKIIKQDEGYYLKISITEAEKDRVISEQPQIRVERE